MVERQQAARVRHWRDVYSAREEGALSWFEARPQVSLDLIEHYLPPGEGAAVIDVGGGTSRLVDALLERGYGPIAVLDIAGAALAAAQRRLGPDADAVTWIAADITGWQPSRQWALWHDRAVFHFLTEERERAAYVAAMVAAIRPGGRAIVATFAEDGPETCSGLPVCRYTPASLFAKVDRTAPGAFRLIEGRRHVHVTPKGNRQNFQITVLQRERQ
ncbi:MAG: methyltransferase domain-containing protein [Albidovulum sp.]|uniref:class I SAM-dependent methyltransferase n=1 Tax=Albidovulum sp. TaxID=1872424 RepID=UPI0039B9BA57